MSNRPRVSIVTDGVSPQGTSIYQNGEQLRGVQSVKTIRDGTRVEIVIHADLEHIGGAQHPFEMHLRNRVNILSSESYAPEAVDGDL